MAPELVWMLWRENPSSLPGTEPRFLGCSARNLVAVTTASSLPHSIKISPAVLELKHVNKQTDMATHMSLLIFFSHVSRIVHDKWNLVTFTFFPPLYKILLKTGPRWWPRLEMAVSYYSIKPYRSSLQHGQEMFGPNFTGHTTRTLTFPCGVKATVANDVTRERINTADLVPVVSQWRRSEPQNLLEVGQRRVDGDLESVELLLYNVQPNWYSIAETAILYTSLLTLHCRYITLPQSYLHNTVDGVLSRTRTRMCCGMSDISQNCEASRRPMVVNGSVSVTWLPQQTSMRQYKSCWKRCSLCGPCQGYVTETSYCYQSQESREESRESLQAVSWERSEKLERQFRDRLEAVTKQCSEDHEWEH
jgi:hypothetical protein